MQPAARDAAADHAMHSRCPRLRLEILDGPYSDFSNFDGFGQECAQARDLGFDGKTLIHPARSSLQRIFTPRPRKWRTPKILAAFERPRTPRAARSRSTADVDGCTPRWPRTIAIADAIAAMGIDPFVPALKPGRRISQRPTPCVQLPAGGSRHGPWAKCETDDVGSRSARKNPKARRTVSVRMTA